MADSTEPPLPPDENRGPEILAVCGSFVGFALAVVLLRIWVRARWVRHVGSDDWAIIAAMTVMFAEMMVIIPQVKLGAGRHVQYIKPPENITKGLHLNFVTQPLCLIGLCLTKVSVGLFLLRLTPSIRFRYFVIGTIIFTVLSATGNLLAVFFQCRPLALIWDSSVEGSCIPPANLKFAAFFNSSVAILTDIIFAFLPIPILWNVQMNWRVKSAVAAILSLGIFAAAAAIVKVTFLGAYGKHDDFSWDSADLTIWTTVEINVAIIAASFPCLRPIFKSLLDGTSVVGRYGSSKYHGYIRKPDCDRTPKSGTGTTTEGAVSVRRNTSAEEEEEEEGPEFEMYNNHHHHHHHHHRTGFTADVKTGNRPSVSGSQESILPQDGRAGRAEGITKTSTVLVSYEEQERRRSNTWPG